MEPSNYLMLVISSCFLFFLVVAGKESAFKRSEEGEIEAKSRHYQTFPLSSFQPSSICSPSTNGEKKRGSLEVVHKHGPCSKFNKDIVKPLTVEEIFTHDQSRVDSINSRLRAAITTTGKDDTKTSMTTLRAKRGTTIDSSNYIVTIGLGTPKKSLSLNFDTGSDLTWTQCEPCISCYKQHEPIFSPSSSTTYTNISCTSADCSGLASATLQPPGCISSNCVYTIRYGDGSLTQGFFVKDTLTITSDDVFDGFFFGCGQNNSGLFGGDAGLIGLGRDKLSLVMQSANKYGKVFSYCLPSTDSSIGFLKFGSNGIGSNVIYTPLVDDSQQRSSFYNLDLEAIYVGEKKLEINPTVFKTSGMIIDSGTVITWLPLPAYLALREAFKLEMTQYDTVNASSILDTCYDFSKYGDGNVTIPTISFVWGGNVKMEIPRQGVFSKHEEQVYCLAFRGNEDDSDTGIFGNTQQKTMEVVYDVAAGKVGFGPSGCA